MISWYLSTSEFLQSFDIFGGTCSYDLCLVWLLKCMVIVCKVECKLWTCYSKTWGELLFNVLFYAWKLCTRWGFSWRGKGYSIYFVLTLFNSSTFGTFKLYFLLISWSIFSLAPWAPFHWLWIYMKGFVCCFCSHVHNIDHSLSILCLWTSFFVHITEVCIENIYFVMQ